MSPAKLKLLLQKFHANNEAATSVEYAIMLMVIVVLCINVIKVIGLDIADSYGDSAESMNSAMNN